MKAYLNGISYYLPQEILDNVKLSSMHPNGRLKKYLKKQGYTSDTLLLNLNLPVTWLLQL